MSAVVTLKKGEGRTIKAGGLWIFDNEIATIVGSFKNGDIVYVHDFDQRKTGLVLLGSLLIVSVLPR